MAKKSAIARDEKRKKMITKFAAKRLELKELGDQEGLAKLPRNSSPTRRTNRCVETGRPRGYMRSSACPALVSANMPARARFPASRKRAGRRLYEQNINRPYC